MKTTFAMLVASALSLASMFALADDRTPSEVNPPEQAKMKNEADAKNAAFAKVTPEERAAARKASDAEHLKYDNTIEKITRNPGESEGSLFALTQNGWVVWFCMMGLWTVMQVLFNLAQTVRDRQ